MSTRPLGLSVALGNLLVPLNSTMIVVALPEVARDLGADVAATSWIITSYLIAMASLQPIAGRIGDRFGRRRVMLGALVYFAMASAAAAAAPTLVVLAFMRLNQAIAASALVPTGLGLLREALPAGRRGAEFGLVSAAAAVGATAGPLIGGVLGAVDWRLLFLVNVPLCALAFALAWRGVPEAAPRPSTRFDLAGALWLGAVLLAASWVLTSLGRAADWMTVALGLAIAPAAVALLRFEAKQADPVLPPSLFRVRAFAAECATVAFQNWAMYGTLLALPITLGGASLQTGAALAMFSGGAILLAPLGGRAADRYGARWPTFAGALILVAGLLPLAISAGRLPLEPLFTTLAVASVGLAFTFPAMRLAAVEAVHERYASLASGVFSTSRYFGGMLASIAVAVALAAPTADSVRGAFALFSAAALAAALSSLLLPAQGVAHREVLEETG